MQLTITSSRDRVILAPSVRVRDLQLKPDEARWLADRLEESADECDQWVNAGGSRTVLTGEPRGALVRSWDGRVNVRFASVVTPGSGESIPFDAARQLAGQIRAKATEAEYRFTFLTQQAG